ncbi:hypothetical protein AAD018_012095 [Aestuariibius insulae]|uniref:hypothetical protein n=1 Tax=Aestuariibius insulae TaxID=2058287 RepID=UPI00345F035D
MFTRDNIVYLVRHGPTDWSRLDERNVAPTDCENQRVMVDDGHTSVGDIGASFASNGIIPARIDVRE